MEPFLGVSSLYAVTVFAGLGSPKRSAAFRIRSRRVHSLPCCFRPIHVILLGSFASLVVVVLLCMRTFCAHSKTSESTRRPPRLQIVTVADFELRRRFQSPYVRKITLVHSFLQNAFDLLCVQQTCLINKVLRYRHCIYVL